MGGRDWQILAALRSNAWSIGRLPSFIARSVSMIVPTLESRMRSDVKVDWFCTSSADSPGTGVDLVMWSKATFYTSDVSLRNDTSAKSALLLLLPTFTPL